MTLLVAAFYSLVSWLTLLSPAGAPAPRAQDLPHAFPREGAVALVDNERVTVWDVTWIKGKPSPMHRHRYDLVGVYLVGSAIRITSPDGTSRESTVPEGFILYQKKDVTHIEEGIDDANPRHAILIDLKDHVQPPLTNTSGYPNAFPRPGATKAIDNDRVTIWEYTWTPGAPTPMHFHDKDAVAVFMEDGVLQSTTPDGRSQESEVKRGMVRFNEAGRVHVETLVRGKARVVAVELK
jgi:predicted metal-dependent enzyme (double-stranded beta helix superfamily)